MKIVDYVRSKMMKRDMNVYSTIIPINDMRCDYANLLTQELFSSPEIQVAINFVAEVFSTIPTYHRRTSAEGGDEYLNTDIDYVLNVNPNSLQNRTQFWVSCVSQLLKSNNLIIYPKWERGGRLINIHPIKYSITQQPVYKNGNYYINISTDKGNETYNVEDLIIVNRFNNINGGIQRNSISPYEQVIQKSMLRALEDLKNPKTVQAYLQLRQGTLPPDTRKKRAEEFKKQIQELKEDGLLNDINIPLINSDVDLKSININAIPIDKDLQNYAKNVVFNYFGLTDDIIQRKVNEYTWQLWLATTIKPLVNQFSEEFSRKLFTAREIQVGNWIEFDLTVLKVATLGELTRAASIFIPQGVNSPDEIREQAGYGKRKDGLGGEFMQTLNNVSASMANEYQLTNAQNGRLRFQNNETVENNQ